LYGCPFQTIDYSLEPTSASHTPDDPPLSSRKEFVFRVLLRRSVTLHPPTARPLQSCFARVTSCRPNRHVRIFYCCHLQPTGISHTRAHFLFHRETGRLCSRAVRSPSPCLDCLKDSQPSCFCCILLFDVDRTKDRVAPALAPPP